MRLVASNEPFGAKAEIDPNPVGAGIAVHYDPADPKTSVLETTTTSGSGRYWAGWIIALVPFLLILFLWWVARR